MNASAPSSFGSEDVQLWLDDHEECLDHGSGALLMRLASQEHWQQAAGVRDGRESSIDPDCAEIEHLGPGIRIYRLVEIDGLVDGRPARISRRLVKFLENGCWRSDVLVESYQRAGLPPISLGEGDTLRVARNGAVLVSA